jgi:hypothetical protein
MLAVTDMAKVARILDRGSGLELTGPRELPLDVPMRTTVSGRIKEGALERRHCPINGALAPARDAGEGVLGGGAESSASRR